MTEFDFKTLQIRLREMAFLTKGLKITLTDEREDPVRSKTYHYEGGIKEFVQYLNRSTTPVYDDIILLRRDKGRRAGWKWHSSITIPIPRTAIVL